MENKDQLSLEEISELEDPYFNLQAKMGFTQVFKACDGLLSLYFKSSTYRKAMKEMAKEARGTPKNLLEY